MARPPAGSAVVRAKGDKASGGLHAAPARLPTERAAGVPTRVVLQCPWVVGGTTLVAGGGPLMSAMREAVRMMRKAARAAGLPVALLVTTLAAMTVTAAVMGAIEPGPPEPPRPPVYVEEAVAAGIAHVYDGEFEYFVGGGVAAFDCDDDGRQDLYIAGGTAPASLYRNLSPTGGALRFERIAAPETDLERVVGAYPLDVDGDGRVDLAVLRRGENAVLRGLGDCAFERANEALAIDGGDQWTVAFSATWEAGASRPTLAFGNYLSIDEAGATDYTCADHQLLRPDAAGSGYAAPIALAPGWCTLSLLFSDWDRSGRRDLRMTNDRHYYRDGEDQLWRIEPGVAPRLYTREDGWQQLVIWGMGIASEDVTGDGYPEVVLTSQGDNRFQELVDGPTQPTYADSALRRGTTAHRPFTGDQTLPSTAWHPEFADVNNDGLMDLYLSKGNVEAQDGYALEDPSDLLLGLPDGTFVESAREAHLLSFGRSRGAALVDLNLDGLLDLIEVNRRENVKLFRNTGAATGDGASTGGAAVPMGHWLALRLRQDGGNRDAIGAWVEVRAGDRTTQREVAIGGGHAGDQLGWVHVGLGDRDRADVRIHWPDGEVGPWASVAADGFYVVERGSEAPTSWQPPQG